MNLDIACETFVKHEEIVTPKKLEGEKCKVYNEYDILYLSSTMTYKHMEWLNVTYEIKYYYNDLKQLNEQLIQLPKITTSKELSNARLSLDDKESIVSSIASHRRIKNWKKTGIEILTS